MATMLVKLAPTAQIAKELATHVVRAITGAGGGSDESKAQATEFVRKSRASVQAGAYLAFINEVLSVGDKILEYREKEAEGCFSVTVSLLNDVATRNEDISDQVAQLLDLVMSSPETRTSLRLAILGNTFNLLGARCSAHRFDVFVSMVKFAAETGNLAKVRPYFSKVGQWAKDWDLSQEQLRGALSLISRALHTVGDSSAAQQFRIQLLSTYEDGDTGSMAEVVPDAVQAIVDFVKNPEAVFSSTKHLIDLAAVRQLEGHAEHGRLFELLHIFAVQKLDAYLAYEAANRDYLTGLGIDHEASLETIRLLSLCSLAAESEDGSIEYSTIASTLQIEADEAEQWLLTAIRAGLLSGRMDQLKSRVHVSGYKRRVFDRAAWVETQARLHAWGNSIAELLSTLRSRGGSGSGSGAGAGAGAGARD